jgi:hypothetical protein
VIKYLDGREINKDTEQMTRPPKEQGTALIYTPPNDLFLATTHFQEHLSGQQPPNDEPGSTSRAQGSRYSPWSSQTGTEAVRPFNSARTRSRQNDARPCPRQHDRAFPALQRDQLTKHERPWTAQFAGSGRRLGNARKSLQRAFPWVVSKE